MLIPPRLKLIAAITVSALAVYLLGGCSTHKESLSVQPVRPPALSRLWVDEYGVEHSVSRVYDTAARQWKLVVR